MDDLVKQAREALEGVTPGSWALDEGGEVHAGGSTVFAWPEWSDQSDPALHRNMEFGAAARDLMPAMADRIEALTAELAAERRARDEAVGAAVEAAYLAGFNVSAEGWNGEWPFQDRGKNPEDDPAWIADRDAAMADQWGGYASRQMEAAE